jgi:hypothetical protein
LTAVTPASSNLNLTWEEQVKIAVAGKGTEEGSVQAQGIYDDVNQSAT